MVRRRVSTCGGKVRIKGTRTVILFQSYSRVYGLFCSHFRSHQWAALQTKTTSICAHSTSTLPNRTTTPNPSPRPRSLLQQLTVQSPLQPFGVRLERHRGLVANRNQLHP